MLHHVELYVSNLDVSFAFWSNILGTLGYEETAFWGEGFTLGRGEGAYLTFVQVRADHAHRPYHRAGVGLNHLAFRVESRAAVDALRDHCKARGITCLYDDRCPFANGGEDYYALYVEDPARIKVEFVAARP
jgi:catechol 2,3-dioxygenase-like lactoylglutathione lyase family enzyme